MTRFLADPRGLMLVFALLLVVGCTPPPGAGDQTQAERYFSVGKTRIQRQDYPGALAAFEQALQADPRMARAHYEIAMLFDKELNAPAKALYHYLIALELEPDFQGADLISNRLSVVKMQVAGDSLPRIPSPALEKEIDRLQGDLEDLRAEYKRLQDINLGLSQQVASLQQQTRTSPPETLRPRDNAVDSGVRMDRQVEPPTPVSSLVATLSERPRNYVIARGDTLYGLSRRFGVSIGELKASNPGISERNFPAGRTISIPAN